MVAILGGILTEAFSISIDPYYCFNPHYGSLVYLLSLYSPSLSLLSLLISSSLSPSISFSIPLSFSLSFSRSPSLFLSLSPSLFLLLNLFYFIQSEPLSSKFILPYSTSSFIKTWAVTVLAEVNSIFSTIILLPGVHRRKQVDSCQSSSTVNTCVLEDCHKRKLQYSSSK